MVECGSAAARQQLDRICGGVAAHVDQNCSGEPELRQTYSVRLPVLVSVNLFPVMTVAVASGKWQITIYRSE
jgi:hypothetical protein